MPLDPVLLADTRAWFRKAAIDLRSVEVDLAATPPILEDAVFHCQQAAEKAMKGFLTYHQQPFGKTHDLRELGKACIQIDRSLEPPVERSMPLTSYAWRFRYPGNPEELALEEAQEASTMARQVVGELLGRLPRDIRS
jgi:HEPN domain-containing protein